ncbi:2-polyprenyl-3-methyl-6-methoxy-1,4-benzoquinone monooxygenase [Marinagarivorans cellulosilyticus]|uniref:3-demethoxyubiquinol 3-hydroxylase n=1 Tax=Marinagarivorans cellulosilyticus TaxID=2721545 RepID=A0AAN1WJ15_9GAMM|nr:2-polyprenyl-3-methyl-6-methoxy-1,4-benzoquinone monooxygenase [Marinagarivorans cellulosilyticus]BCD98482.1 3-demethoxyubiquinol 3-hydroxylase [Marinagarivorans cellulosilyticus]
MQKNHQAQASLRNLSCLDNAVSQCDTVLKTLLGQKTNSQRPNPAQKIPEPTLNAAEKIHSAGLMRVNHTGEVCAQALYQGQALTAKLPSVKEDMKMAAIEEEDHLAWCQERLNELGATTSRFNALWYSLSFSLGAGAGLVSDKLSLGFVAATEQQVCKHLDNHLKALPRSDDKSRAIITQMRQDEAEHAEMALTAGGVKFPAPVKAAMSQVAKVMTSLSYRC